MNFNLHDVQTALKKLKIPCWIMTDYQRTNQPAVEFLGLDPSVHASRRWFYLIQFESEPVKIVSAVEPNILDHLPGKRIVYNGRAACYRALKDSLNICACVAMEYSPEGRLPNISRVDAGTVELIRTISPEITSSANLLQELVAKWSPAALAHHRIAAGHLREIVASTFENIRNNIGGISELEVQQYIMTAFSRQNLICDHPPICATGDHSANPHYNPTPETNRFITDDTLVLIDLWAKLNVPGSVYADITWMGYAGETIPEEIDHLYHWVMAARDHCVASIKNALAASTAITGAQADAACRDILEKAGLGPYFTHRTGHSLGQTVHGLGANLDSFESMDDRLLIPLSGFTIEPGVYLPGRFGLRTEINAVILEDGSIEISGQPIQTAIVHIIRN